MNNEAILQETASVYPEAVKWRRYLHENPEIGNGEHKTTEYIAGLLEQFGIEVQRPLETGCVGMLRCGDGAVIALRADIDALPVKEETGLPFGSKTDGLMHACGHDIHTAALLAAAKMLSQHRDELCGTVKFIFQPDEEGNGGADRLVKCGIFENPGVDRVFGIHINPALPSGKVAVKYGKSYAASDVFEITVTGKSSHAAEPNNGRNALVAASKIACALEGIVPQVTAPTDSAVVSVCTLKSGTACNIIPEKAVMTGIIRTLGAETRQKMKKAFADICVKTAQSCGCEAGVKIRESYPGVVNGDKETDFILRSARELFGDENAVVISEPTMTTEDFGYYLMKAPGCFYHVGAGSDYPLHNGKMAPDEQCIRIAAAMHVKSVVSVMAILSEK